MPTGRPEINQRQIHETSTQGARSLAGAATPNRRRTPEASEAGHRSAGVLSLSPPFGLGFGLFSFLPVTKTIFRANRHSCRLRRPSESGGNGRVAEESSCSFCPGAKPGSRAKAADGGVGAGRGRGSRTCSRHVLCPRTSLGSRRRRRRLPKPGRGHRARSQPALELTHRLLARSLAPRSHLSAAVTAGRRAGVGSQASWDIYNLQCFLSLALPPLCIFFFPSFPAVANEARTPQPSRAWPGAAAAQLSSASPLSSPPHPAADRGWGC